MDNNFINFEIRPIFNPSDDVYKDFEHIELLCDDWLGGIYKDSYKQSCWEHHKTTAQEKNAFAFAAYYENQMLGFSDGYVINDVMYLDSLFVNPKYHCFGVGTGLLKVSEQSASIIKSNMLLMPLTNALHFYYQNGYGYNGNLAYLSKTLSKTVSGVVPVFEWCYELSEKLNVKVDVSMLNECKGKPLFVYVDKNARISGVAVCLPNGKDFVKCTKTIDNTARYCRLKLIDALNQSR